MKNIVENNNLKDKFETIRNDIMKRRDKKSISKGSIVYYGEDNLFGVCTSNKTIVTLENSNLNPKVIETEISNVEEYYIACINKEVFKDEKLSKVIKEAIGEQNIFNSRYKNSYDFINKKINLSKGKENKANTFKDIKKVLEKEYGINKWLSSFTGLSIKELEEKIEDKKKEKEKIKKDYQKSLDENLKKQEDILKELEKQENNNEKREELENIQSMLGNKEDLKNDLSNLEEDNNEKEKSDKEKGDLISKIQSLLGNKEDLKNDLSNLKEEEKQIQKEFNEKNEQCQNQIISIQKELEKAKEQQIKEAEEDSSNLEKNMKSLINDLNSSSEEKIEESLEKIGIFKSLKEEIKDEDIKGKNEIIYFINNLEKIDEDYKKNNEVMRGWDLSLAEFKKLGPNFLNLLHMYKNNPKLKKFVDKIGRKATEYEKEIEIFEKINRVGNEEILGIELNDDIMRVLPSELVYLSNPDTEDIFYLKYLEKKLLCYSLIGNEKEEKEKNVQTEEKGAIIALLDTSGSMNGVPIENSRAILLQAFKIAKNDKRDMKVMLFGSVNQVKEYTVDSKYDINNFINFISGGYSGGTDYETPINKAINIVTSNEKYKFADIFMLTDGACLISSNLSSRIREAKKKLDLKIYTVIFGGYGFGDIDNFSDEIFKI